MKVKQVQRAVKQEDVIYVSTERCVYTIKLCYLAICSLSIDDDSDSSTKGCGARKKMEGV